jgi:hypothetical protein
MGAVDWVPLQKACIVYHTSLGAPPAKAVTHALVHADPDERHTLIKECM